MLAVYLILHFIPKRSKTWRKASKRHIEELVVEHEESVEILRRKSMSDSVEMSVKNPMQARKTMGDSVEMSIEMPTKKDFELPNDRRRSKNATVTKS